MEKLLVGNGLFNESFKCNDTDEELLKYLGLTWKSTLTERVYEHDLDIFRNAVSAVMEKGISSESVRIRFLTESGELRNCRVRIYGRQEDRFFIEIVDIENACNGCYEIISQQKQNEWLLSMEGTVLFNYDVHTREFEIYKYSDNGKLNLLSVPAFSTLSEQIVRDIESTDLNISYHKSFTIEDRVFQVIGTVRYQQTEKIALFGLIREESGTDSAISGWGDTHDAMTGLYNKPFALSEARRLVDLKGIINISLIMIDLDDFKTINDTFGHIFGDKVIQKMAQILHEASNGRGFASRFGGDEFFLCLTDLKTEDELRAVLQSIQFKFRNAFPDKDHKFSTSIGIAEYPRNSRSFDVLLKKADRALYIAKFKGKSRYIIYKEELHGQIEDNAPDMVKPDTTSRDAQIRLGLKIIESYRNALDSDAETIGKTIDDMLVDILLNYKCDAMTVYSGETCLPVLRKGHYSTAPENALYMKNPDVMALFNEYGAMHTNYSHIGGTPIEEFHTMLANCGIASTNFILIGNADKPEALFAYDNMHDTGGWSNEEMSDLIMYSNLLYTLITR